MTTFHIDGNAQQLRGTGVVDPVMDWVEDVSTGRRRQADQQSRNDAGLPLWSVEALVVSEDYGRQSTQTVRVIVPSPSEPTPTPFELMNLSGLQVNVSVDRRTNSLRQSWRADALVAAAAGSSRTRDAA